MKKIDKETVSRILDTADIVDVVSDFVTLKKRGANYIGLCPFHSERTPSFSVSKSKGICKCFSCGKGGSPINFLMELEQMSYQEALRWLAKKYNIEIVEREETEQEKQKASRREALFAVNNFAMQQFEKNLHETEEGRNIGLAYFVERGLSIETIKKFHLGYDLERSDSLYKEAIRAGYTEENLIATGLCSKSDRGVYDRFKSRVIYPVLSISGKVVAFGGRTLRSDKTIAKYVNSPESDIYSKSRELYGLFQARRAIVKEEKCILVEGYMDVLSMSQSGVENVVASSGTSLTSQQVNLIHRFTDNVTVIYDADAAGIKASLRGIDMLLSEGMSVKIVLFPPGEDPDSYAQSHSKTELEQYLNENEVDFIKFKTTVLLKDVGDDPIKRSHAISDILKSISVIPDSITRQLYIEQTARTFGLDAKVIALEVSKGVALNAENQFKERQRAEATKSNQQEPKSTSEKTDDNVETTEPVPTETVLRLTPQFVQPAQNPLLQFEKNLIRYLFRYGMLEIGRSIDENNNDLPVSVLEYVRYELEADQLSFSDKLLNKLYNRLLESEKDWELESDRINEIKQRRREEMEKAGLERIRHESFGISQIEKAEKELKILISTEMSTIENEARRRFFEKGLLSDSDDALRNLATELAEDRHRLSRVHSKFAHIETEEERLIDLIPRAVYELKDAILRLQIDELNKKMRNPELANSEIEKIMTELMEKSKIRAEFARYLGDRIITPLLKSF